MEFPRSLNNRFSVRDRIGRARGGRTGIWRAEDRERAGCSCVLKVYPLGTDQGETPSEIVLYESLDATRCRRAHIAPILDSGTSDEGYPWLATEDVGPLTLSGYRDEGFAGFGEALDLAEALARALAYLHGSRVVHLDVTEANIVVIPRPLGRGASGSSTWGFPAGWRWAGSNGRSARWGHRGAWRPSARQR